MTLIEAAASGLPVVATDDGGPRDIIKNCQNGILTDVTYSENIAESISKILSDKSLWRKYSSNGTKNVKKYYTWEAHTKTYLDEIENMLKKELHKKDTFAPIGKKLFTAEKLIVTDIDNTLLGDDNYTKDFSELLRNKHENIRFAVATGRTVNSALSILKENNIPHPDVIISSVGSEIFFCSESFG